MTAAGEIFLGSIAVGVLAMAFRQYKGWGFIAGMFLAFSVVFCMIGMIEVGGRTPPIDKSSEQTP